MWPGVQNVVELKKENFYADDVCLIATNDEQVFAVGALAIGCLDFREKLKM